MRQTALCVAACVIAALVPAIARAQERNFAFGASGFGLALPTQVAAVRQITAEDEFYTFTYQGRTILSAYVGNQPIDTVFREHKQYTTSGRYGQLSEQSIIYTYPGDVQSRETIVTLGVGGWPRYVHFWYLNLQPDIAAAMDRAIASIGPVSAATAAAQKPALGSWGLAAQKLLQQPRHHR